MLFFVTGGTHCGETGWAMKSHCRCGRSVAPIYLPTVRSSAIFEILREMLDVCDESVLEEVCYLLWKQEALDHGDRDGGAALVLVAHTRQREC